MGSIFQRIRSIIDLTGEVPAREEIHMDDFKKVALKVWVDAIEEALDQAHDDLMDLKYADEVCAFYNEDEVWDVKNRCSGKIRHILNMMRKELQDESGKM